METNFKKKKICFSCEKNEVLQNRKYCVKCLYQIERLKQIDKRKKKKEREALRKLKRKEKRENNISKLTKKADQLFSIAIRLRDKRCRRTGNTENLQCSHIWGRSNKFLRWDMDNAFTLSAGQHLYWWHKEPAEAIEWAKQELGEEKWNELKQKKNQPFKLTAEFIKERIEFLKKYIDNKNNN